MVKVKFLTGISRWTAGDMDVIYEIDFSYGRFLL